MTLALLIADSANKPSLISESGVNTQVNIHPAGDNLTTRHMHGLYDPTHGNSL
jgi:hypothetical protein